MKVFHDFTITEQDIISCALKEYFHKMKASVNLPRAFVADSLIDIIYPF